MASPPPDTRSRNITSSAIQPHLTIHNGPYWITAEGRARLYTWDDTDPETIRRLLRDLYVIAGGTHDDWETYDRVVREERRAAVVMTPERIYVRRPRIERN